MSWLRRAELWLVLPLVIGLAIAVIAGGKREVYTNQWEPASTFKSGPNGGRAPYDVLARLGVPVERRRTAFFDLAREVRRRPAELAVVAPSFSVMPAEVDAVADYVRSGGRVVIGGDAGDLSRCFGWYITTASSDTSHALDSVAVRIPSPFQVLPHVWQVLMPLDTGKAGR